MDFGSVKNLNPLKDISTPASNRSEAPAPSSSAQGPSFGSVLAARQLKSAAPKVAPKTETLLESDAAPVEETFADPSTPSFEAPASLAPKFDAVARLDPKINAPAADDANDTEGAWAEFLTQMNEQLNVKPADVLSAFEKLSDDDLNAKPEDTTDQMVAAMGLTGQGALLAKQMLTKLIVATEKPPVETAVDADPIADLHEAKSLTRALDRMDAALLLNKKSVAPAPAPSVPDAAAGAEPLETKSDLAELTASTAEASPAPTPTASPAPPANEAVPAKSTSVDAAAMNALVDQMKPVSTPETLAARPRVDQLVQNIINAAPNPGPAAFAAKVDGEELDAASVEEVATPAPRSASKALDALIAKATKYASDQKSERESDDESDLDSDLSSNGEARTATATTKSNDFAAKLSNETAAPGATAPASAPDLVENARLMVKDGGGEMKVKINSEVGEIEMKVSVVDGKVSVQMVAETDEAKQILETQLGDLKSQLTAHHLQIDKLRVDTGGNLGQQRDQDNSQQQNQRQAANDGWNQMNQQNRNQQQGQTRRQMFDAPNARAYGAPTRASTATPAPVARAANSRRLNLVA